MRLLGRKESVRPSKHIRDDPGPIIDRLVLQLPDVRLSIPPSFSSSSSISHLNANESSADTHAPSKAERVLGTTTDGETFGATKHDRRTSAPSDEEEGSRTPIAEQKALGSLWGIGTEELPLGSPTAMQGTNGGLRPWPSAQQSSLAAGMQRSRMPAAAPSTADSRQCIPREASDSTLRSYYEPARAPVSISQQTSDSAVRDMAWRKVSPQALASKSESHLPKPPLKSALKQSSPESDRRVKKVDVKTQRDSPKVRRLDFSHLLVRRNLPETTNTPPRPSNGSSTSLNVVPIPYTKSKSSKKTKVVKGEPRYELSASVPNGSATRPKVFETDVFDNAKVNVRRPPKGIQNWFDGFDISSDEEERQAPVELPGSEPVSAGEALPSTFSPYAEATSGQRQRVPAGMVPVRNSSQVLPPQSRPNPRRNPSDDIVFENIQAINQARQQMQARQAAQAALISRKNTAESGVHPTRNRSAGRESRLASSSLANESVLALSDTSEDERVDRRLRNQTDSSAYDAIVSDASPVNVRRAPGPPRQLQTHRSFARDTYMTTQTSGSIPITLDDDGTMPSLVRRDTQGSTAKHTAAALQQLTGRSSAAVSRPPSTQPSMRDQDGSAADGSVSSFPFDAAHMMAVTEEEMALLEMMRNKRAAMAKDSFTEGYRLALKREQEQLLLRRQSAQKTALKILKQKGGKERSRGGSRDEIPELSDEQIRRLSTIKHEDVDHQLKLERYLTTDTPTARQFPEPPMHSRKVLDDAMVRHSEALLLLPRTYTPQSFNKVEASPLLPSPSTIGGASERSSTGAAQLQAEVSRFLAAGGRADSVAFPMPPQSSLTERRKSQRSIGRAALYPASIDEESYIPPLPSRSPNRLAHAEGRTPSPQARRDTLRGDPRHHTPSPALSYSPYVARDPETNRLQTPFLDPPDISPFDFPSPFASTTATPTAGTRTDPSITPSQASTSLLRNDSPSLSTSRASPMTPEFGHHSLLHDTGRISARDHGRVEIANSSDGVASPTASGSEMGVNLSMSKRGPQPVGPLEVRKQKRVPRALLEVGVARGSVEREASVGSVNSAAGDVLAAWAELGGGSESLMRRRMGA
ncbi:hypothetical protein B0A48_01696 [Cryoendolithus antarcticus]|uniref:Uncharacterized protein n=1 Tax=Cryoendolithus antarcticus TaxID=1507870 RepID=A0A1V8TQE3_9PEZI|nr:hypothetical protein B0A48_01696 [Cryoendolithus antarcticus]